MWLNLTRLFKGYAGTMFPLIAGCLLVGCSTLPDAQPFAAATANLRSAVAASGVAVVSEIEQVEIEGVKAQAKSLEKAWEERNRVLSALVTYSSSLVEIVEAGKKGAEAAEAVADSVSSLAMAAGIAMPGAGEAGAVVTETAKFVYDQIAKARAARALEKAMSEVQPAIERIAQKMATDMGALDDIVRTAGAAQRNHLKIANQTNLAYRASLEKKRGAMMAEMTALLERDLAPGQTQLDNLRTTTDLLAATETWRQEYRAQHQTIASRERLARQLIAETKAGLANWATGHGRMLAAVKLKRIPSAAEITESVTNIRNLVERYEKLF